MDIMNNLSIYQINFASRITDKFYSESKFVMNNILNEVIKNKSTNRPQQIAYFKCKIIVMLYEQYHFINLNHKVSDEELNYYLANVHFDYDDLIDEKDMSDEE